MNTRLSTPRRNLAPFSLLTALLAFGFGGLVLQRAEAAVSASVSIWHGYDVYYPQAGLDVTSPAPVTFHWLENASGRIWVQFGSTNGSDNFSTNDLSALIHESTNGLWKLYLNRGDVSEQLYYFKVSMTDITSNLLGNVEISFPLDGSTGVTNTPTYQWTGPDQFPTLTANSYKHPDGNGNNYFTSLPSTSTAWTPGPLTPGPNYLLLIYSTNNYPGITFTTPTNSSGTPLADWTAQGNLSTYAYSFFSAAGTVGLGGHQLQAHYSFENGQIFANDISGNDNNISSISSSGGGTRYTTNNPALGNFSAFFNNNGGGGGGWLIAPPELLPTMEKSFTVSAWVRTTQTSGNDSDSGLFGNAGLVTAFTGPGSTWVVPMAITGNKLAFATGGTPQHTLHSVTPITNGSAFVHLVVTRNQLTGEKKIYVNGAPDATGTGSTDLLDSPTSMNIGYHNGTGVQGAMDEIQFYSGVLSAAEVAFLYANPGSSVPDVQGNGDPDLAEAVDAPQLPWFTGGNADWFLQTDETSDGDDAAQSGVISQDGESWIETTVQGPGYFSFSWNISSHDDDNLEFSVNGSYEDDIYGEWGWDSYGVYLDAGTNTLRWTYHKNSGESVGADAAWLDEVSYEPEFNIDMSLIIERSNDPDSPGFFAYPELNSYAPAPLTSHEVRSPNGLFFAFYDGVDENYSGYSFQGPLQDVIDEIQAGPWTLYFNRGHASERQYTFAVSANGLDLTNFPAVNLNSPTEGATGIATNHTFTWTGPTNYNSLFLSSTLVSNIYTTSGGFANLSPTVTTTVFPNPLKPGTNEVYINYRNDNYSGVTLSDPQTGSFETLSSWSYQVNLVSSQTRRFVVGGVASPPTLPVTLLNPQTPGGNFQLQFLSQSGTTNTVQSRTNLTLGIWIDRTNILGDGNTKTVSLPVSSAPTEFFRVLTQ